VAALPGGDARRKGGIVAIATVPHDNLPRPLLLRSGREVVRIGFAHRLQFQVSLFRPADANPELLGLLAKALARLTPWGKTQRLAAGSNPLLLIAATAHRRVQGPLRAQPR